MKEAITDGVLILSTRDPKDQAKPGVSLAGGDAQAVHTSIPAQSRPAPQGASGRLKRRELVNEVRAPREVNKFFNQRKDRNMNATTPKLSSAEAQRLVITLINAAKVEIDVAASARASARDRARALRRLERAIEILKGRKTG